MFNFTLLEESMKKTSQNSSPVPCSEQTDTGETDSWEETDSSELCTSLELEETDTWEDVCFAMGVHMAPLVDMRSLQPAVDMLNGITVSRNDPGQNVLAAWAQHKTANSILKQFTLYGNCGKTDIMTMEDLRQLFAAADLSPKWFVSKFKKVEHELDIEETMVQIILRFSSETVQGKLVMNLRDVYRLLEALDLGRRRFVKIFSELDDDEFYAYDQFGRLQIFRDAVSGYRHNRPPKVRIGNYFLEQEIGEGMQGGVVYKAENAQTTKLVALKWPVMKEELEALKSMQRRLSSKSILPWPELLDSGTHNGKPFAVTSLLGADLTKVFGRFARHHWQRRWRAVRIFGRLLLRRLEVVHNCGYVHCDVSPLNILLGPPPCNPNGQGHGPAPGKLQLLPYLIDFGQARKHPGGGKLSGDKGSMEWSSIRSAEGGEPTPADDLEALGWTLVYGLVGDLPWFELLSDHYAKHFPPTKAPMEVRLNVINQVREIKMKLLDKGWKSLGAEWWKLAILPEELLQFFDLCRSNKLPQGRAGYVVLNGMLGGKPGLDEQAAEQEDIRQYQEDVLPLL